MTHPSQPAGAQGANASVFVSRFVGMTRDELVIECQRNGWRLHKARQALTEHAIEGIAVPFGFTPGVTIRTGYRCKLCGSEVDMPSLPGHCEKSQLRHADDCLLHAEPPSPPSVAQEEKACEHNGARYASGHPSYSRCGSCGEVVHMPPSSAQAGVSGGFFAERDRNRVASGMRWSPDAGHQLHVITACSEGFVAVGVSTENSLIMGVVMTPEQAEQHIADVRRMLEIVRSGGGSA